MLREYAPLEPIALQKGAGFAHPTQELAAKVTLDSPALDVMTDFAKVSAVIVAHTESADEAHLRMRQRGVRALLVLDEARRVVGVVTTTDVLGEKPLQASQARGVPHHEVMVADIMTPQANMEVLNFDDVRHSKVGHVVSFLKRVGRQHAVVAETGAGGRQTVRGLFSVTQIARQLGVAIQTTEIAHTFSEIESTLAR
jgi:CBS-domain-containing membrane protein